MARTFRRQRQTAPIADLNVTNLIDLGFTLLIIFMIATPLINQEQKIDINLPTETKRAQEKPDPKQRFQIVSIDRHGQYFWGTRRIEFGDLPALFAEEARKTDPAVIRIRADWNLQYQKVISVVDELKKHNLLKVAFDTQAAD